MKCKVIGVQYVDYVSRKTGNQVKGTTLFVCYKDQGVDGDRAESLYIPDSLECKDLFSIQPGSVVEVAYNRFGRVADVALCKN